MKPCDEMNPAGLSRRRLLSAAAGVPLLAAGLPAHAGSQVEEPLADSVRGALAAAVTIEGAPPKPVFDALEHRLSYLKWLGTMSERLKRWAQEARARIEFLETVWYESKRAGLEPALVLGLIHVESGFRKYAISSAGARGYMQVMPFWVRVIGLPHQNLFNLRTNLRYGCVILRHYVNIENGDYFRALGR